MKQTAVEWLVDCIMSRGLYTKEMLEEFEQAKAMENQEKISLLEWIRFNANEVPNGWQFGGIFYTDEEILNQFKK